MNKKLTNLRKSNTSVMMLNDLASFWYKQSIPKGVFKIKIQTKEISQFSKQM